MATAENVPAIRQPRVTMIKGLVPSLPERGKIKIGAKAAMVKSRNGTEFHPPKKLDHFLITTLQRGEDGNFVRDVEIHKLFGDKPVEIPVRLLYDDPSLNFPTRYACFIGRNLWCAGDGESAMRTDPSGVGKFPVNCTCERQDMAYKGQDKCKMNGVLSVIIDGAGGVGGVWKFRTTSFNTITGIMSSLAFLKSVTGGVLANIPLMLTVRPKQATDPEGRQQTIYVVGLEFRGNIEELQAKGHQIALDRATTHLSITHIEDEARRLLAAPVDAPLPGDDRDDIVEEFYSEQLAAPSQGNAPRPSRDDPEEEPATDPAAQEQQAEPTDEETEAVYELYDAQGEIVLATSDEQAYATKFFDLLAQAVRTGDGAALEIIAENNVKSIDDFEDRDLAERAYDILSNYRHQVTITASTKRAGR